MAQTGIKTGSCWKLLEEGTPVGSLMRELNFNGLYDLGIFLGWMRYEHEEHDYVKCDKHDFINEVNTIYAVYLLNNSPTNIRWSLYKHVSTAHSISEFYAIEK